VGELPPDRYSEINRRTTRLNSVGAALIWLSTAVAVWGDWRGVAIVLASMMATIGFNVWINLHALPRYGVRIEPIRVIANSSVCVVVGVLTGWPAPCWLWPPYVALAFDQSGGGFSLGVVIWTIAFQDAVGVISGAGWIPPLTSTVLALYAWRTTTLRLHVIREMLASSDHQRAELADANAQTRTALDQLKQEIATRERVELELRAAQKLEAIGRISAGVAHEINTPIQFVGDNLRFLRDGVTEILALRELDAAARGAPDDARADAVAAIEAAEQEADVGYLRANLSEAVGHALDGVDRVAAIVASMRQFAHTAGGRAVATDLNQAIQATLTISRNEYKLVADVECALSELPHVVCHPGEINQVLLNIVVNAAQAIGEAVGNSGTRGAIRVATAHDGDDVVISISDTGTGIPVAARDYVFEPFFTTKEVGRGTGQGLAIARAIIERHRGRLTFDTELGRGTTFHVRLPIQADG
jgi:signal transduction histidine kinase